MTNPLKKEQQQIVENDFTPKYIKCKVHYFKL